jgi:hypothetical protein
MKAEDSRNRTDSLVALSYLIHNPKKNRNVNPLNAELNPIRHLLALVRGHHFVHVSRIRNNIPLETTCDVAITFKCYNYASLRK